MMLNSTTSFKRNAALRNNRKRRSVRNTILTALKLQKGQQDSDAIRVCVEINTDNRNEGNVDGVTNNRNPVISRNANNNNDASTPFLATIVKNGNYINHNQHILNHLQNMLVGTSTPLESLSRLPPPPPLMELPAPPSLMVPLSLLAPTTTMFHNPTSQEMMEKHNLATDNFHSSVNREKLLPGLFHHPTISGINLLSVAELENYLDISEIYLYNATSAAANLLDNNMESHDLTYENREMHMVTLLNMMKRLIPLHEARNIVNKRKHGLVYKF